MKVLTTVTITLRVSSEGAYSDSWLIRDVQKAAKAEAIAHVKKLVASDKSITAINVIGANVGWVLDANESNQP